MTIAEDIVAEVRKKKPGLAESNPHALLGARAV